MVGVSLVFSLGVQYGIGWGQNIVRNMVVADNEINT